MANLDSILKQRYYFPNKGPSSQGYGFFCGHVWMWSWTVKKAERWRTDAFELWCWRRHLRVPWTARRSNQSILKEISPGISLEIMVLKLKLWPPHAKSWLIGKDSDAGRDWGQEEKVMTEDEMAGWHHRLNVHEFEWTPGVGDGQGSLACCDSWGRRESDTTEQLNWTELNWICSNTDLPWNQVKYFSHFILVFQYSFSFSSSFAFSYKFENSSVYILEKHILLDIGVLGRWSLPKWFLSW